MQAWADKLQQQLTDTASSLNANVTLTTLPNGEQSHYLPTITLYIHQLPQRHTLDTLFLASSDYGRLMNLTANYQNLLSDSAFLRRGDKEFTVKSFDEIWMHIMDDARRGLGIQRYKGLGEMNADQLWETTMDPDNRRMLQVTIEDAIKADHMFSCLMGDDVEPRRAFIEENALNADIDA